MRRIRVEVTQADIDKGLPEMGPTCPVAIAIARRVGFAVWVWHQHWTPLAGRWTVTLRPTPMYQVSPAATDFIRAFDHGKPVRPFTFYAQAPELAE